MKGTKFFLLHVFFFILPQLQAQKEYNFQQLDNSSGLSNSSINYIFQDSDNLLWLATWDGLNMYDGSSFHVFNYQKGNKSNSIGNNIIYQIEEDKKRNIWISTIEGVSKYNKNSGKFVHYFYDRSNNNNFLRSRYLLAINSRGTVYCTSDSKAYISCYDEKANQFVSCRMAKPATSKPRKIFFDKEDNLWILDEAGMLSALRLDGNNTLADLSGKQIAGVENVFYVNGEVFFTTADKHLLKIDKSFNRTELLLLPKAVRSMAFYKGRYFFAWSSVGIGEYDRSFKPLPELLNKEFLFNNRRITYLKTANENILWAGTDGNGVINISENINPFGLVKQLPNGSSISIPVRAFCEVEDELWIGTKGNGIITIKNLGKLNASNKVIQTFYSGTDLMDNCVYAISQGYDGLVYIGSDAAGITVYDKKKKKFTYWNQIAGSERYPLFRSAHAVLPDSDSSIWVGTESYGLLHVKLKQNSDNSFSVTYLERYKYTGDEKGPGNDIIYSLSKGINNQLWIGCRYGGLSLFNTQTKTFKTFKAFTYEKSISNNDVLSLYEDSRNRIWIGTSYGLNWLDAADVNKDNPAFGKLNMESGLPNNTVHGITEDDKGDIWLSTNKGLVRIDPVTLKNVSYKKDDELQSSEFSDNAVWKNQAGYVFFGGIYGFNYFKPDNLRFNSESPKLLLSNLKLAGTTVDSLGLHVLGDANAHPLQFTLNRKDNFFELNLIPVKFSDQEKWRYTYLLEGNDKAWSSLPDDRRISYSNVPPGNYTLKIKWLNSEGIWSEEIQALTIDVKQYLWLTFPAFVLYTGLLALFLYLWFQYRRNKLIMQHKLSMEHMLRTKDEELHQQQLNFFTNIAHELQSPLTLISGALERFIYKNKQEGRQLVHHNFLSIVKQQTSRLSYLVYQLLEFRKAEAGALKNNYSQINVSNLLFNISELFAPLIEQRHLNFSCEIEPGMIVWTDKDKLEKILFNLLSNAIKHTSDEESIMVTLVVDKAANKLKIAVANSGHELSQAELDKLFGRFIVLDDSQQTKISSGIGLAFSRELAALLQGTISVSNKNRWISFVLELPLTYQPAEETILKNAERSEKPSFILESMTAGLHEMPHQASVENNKNALIKNLEDDSKKSILVIEDDPAIRFLLNDILNDTYIVYEAYNGKEALALMQRVVPDLIISDVMMPDMNGLEVCNVVKETPATCHIPFILLSARGSIDHKTEGYEAGADAYIPKPFHTEHLLVRVKKLIEYQERLHSLFRQDRVMDKLPENGIKEEDKIFLKTTISIIEDKIDYADLDAAYLEKELSLSRANFFRKVKALSGMTPGELIKSIRLQRVAQLLISSELTVLEIFYKTGFNNQSHFFREFKKRFGCSPNEYRAKHNIPSEKEAEN